MANNDCSDKIKTKEILEKITPEKALELLKEGNKRFLSGNPAERDHHWHIRETIDSQHPFALIHGCIDSRVEPSIIFDQGIGDLFITRIAGNIINDDILGSLEYACAVTGSKLIVVLGHTSCGAVKGACDDVKLGNLTASLKNIRDVIGRMGLGKNAGCNSTNNDLVNRVALKNVETVIEEIKAGSKVLKEMYDSGKIDITGAMYNHTNGKVDFI
jgi:carbonic anhydrase